MTIRWVIGGVLAAAGVGLVVYNGRKLVSDWPRPKPRHNVDLAWIQVYFGLAAVALAWVVVRDPARALLEPTPQVMSAESAERGP